MRISPLLHRSPSETESLYRSSESGRVGQSQASTPLEQELLHQIQHNPALTEILFQRDVRDMTVRDFSEMIEQLRAADLISEEHRNLLAGVPGDLADFGIEPDESVDLVDFYESLVARAQSALERAETPEERSRLKTKLANFDQRLQWMQKLEALAEGPHGSGIDATV